MSSKLRQLACLGILLVAVSMVITASASATEVSKTQYVGTGGASISLLNSVSTGHTYTVTGKNAGVDSTLMYAVFDSNHLYGGNYYPPGGVYTVSHVAQSYDQFVSLYAAAAPGSWLPAQVTAIVDY